MATAQITLDSEQVLGIASQLESDNRQLQTLLTDSKTKVDNLASIWTGQAAEETRASYEAFANKFFQSYYDVIDQYVKFLRRNVAEGYTEVEGSNVRLADVFK